MSKYGSVVSPEIIFHNIVYIFDLVYVMPNATFNLLIELGTHRLLSEAYHKSYFVVKSVDIY